MAGDRYEAKAEAETFGQRTDAQSAACRKRSMTLSAGKRVKTG